MLQIRCPKMMKEIPRFLNSQKDVQKKRQKMKSKDGSNKRENPKQICREKWEQENAELLKKRQQF